MEAALVFAFYVDIAKLVFGRQSVSLRPRPLVEAIHRYWQEETHQEATGENARGEVIVGQQWVHTTGAREGLVKLRHHAALSAYT